MKFLAANPSDARLLTEIARHSKAHWGYDPSLMELWDDQLTINEATIKLNYFEICYDDDYPVGFFSIDREDKELNDFWLQPNRIGTGLGRRMFERMNQVLNKEGIDEIRIVSDPHADGFYRHMGAKKVDLRESLPEGRYLTVFMYRARK